jgi:hypothetical protein
MKDTRSIYTGLFLVAVLIIGGVIWYVSASNATGIGASHSLKSPQTLKLGEEKIIEGLTVSPSAVTEDSRCPQGANCIWAGQVVVTVALSADGQSKSGPLKLNEPTPYGSYEVTLTNVSPDKKQGKEIEQKDYVLTFSVKKAGTAGTANSTVKTYTNDQYGFSFSYPSTYYLETHTESAAKREHFAVVLTEDTKENQDVRNGNTPARDGPVAITLDVYKDPIGNPTLLEWLKDTPGSNFNISNGTYTATKLAGKDAVIYHWSGLYEADTLATQNKDYTFAATVTYIAKADPIVAVYNNLIKTISFK